MSDSDSSATTDNTSFKRNYVRTEVHVHPDDKNTAAIKRKQSKTLEQYAAMEQSENSDQSELELNTMQGPSSSKKRKTSQALEDLVQQKVNEILSKQQYWQAIPNSLRFGSSHITAKNDIVPSFDPEKSDITSTNWLHKIEQLGMIHSWDDATKSYYMQSKLSGVAKIWYNALRDYNKTWDEWKISVAEAFPSHEYFVDNLKKMMERKKVENETMMHYYYSKCILIRKCEISDTNAVSCIIDGLPLGIQGAAKAGNYRTPEELFQGFLSKLESDSIFKGSHASTKRDTLKDVVCYICNKPGHVGRRCRLRAQYSKFSYSANRPFKKCANCGKNGHLKEDCWFVKNATVKTLQRQVNDFYHIPITINNIECNGYLDTGSQINVAQVSLLNKLNIELDTPNTCIIGFGNQIVYPLGQALVNINFNNFTIATVVHFVNVNMGKIDIIIGQPVINNDNVELLINGTRVELKRSDKNNTNFNKFPVKIIKSITIPPKTTAPVQVKNDSSSDLIIPAKECHHYSIPTTFTNTPVFTINVTNTGHKNIILESNSIVTRGYQMLHDEMTCCNNHISIIARIETSKIKVDHIKKTYIPYLFSLLNKFSNCFATNTSELGITDVIEFDINLISQEPIFYKPYRLSEKEKQIVRQKIKDLLDNNIIRESKSCYASPAILVKKKNGDYRIAVDYRKLNNITRKDRYPLPHIEDHIGRLKGYKYFCVLDMTQGYYQVPVAEGSITKTAFVTPDGQYEFLRMPFGVCNAPATFQRLLNSVLGNLRHEKVVVYLDDILIPSHTVEEGLEILETILKLFDEANLKLNLDKCLFFEVSIEYLGYEINEFGIRPGQRKINAVLNFPTPKNVHQIRQFLGLSSYFRKFIKNHALIVQPLCQLLKKNVEWQWGEPQVKAFETIKKLLTNRPLLSIFDVNLKTELHTDASSKGIAGILMQHHKQGLKPVMYYSRATTKEESVYHSYELETLAVVEAIKRFRVYLTLIHFIIVTDCSAVRSTFSKKDLLPRIARWWLTIQEYDFEIEHRPGSKMQHVDALSRNLDNQHVLTLNTEDWISCIQAQDDEIRSIKKRLEQDNPDPQLRKLYSQKNGRLYRKTADGLNKLVIPKYARFNLLRKYHDDIGHIGLNKCEILVKSRFWFKGMTRFIKKYVKACLDCAYKRGQYGKKEGYLFPIQKPTEPLHTWHIDHLGPFCKSSGFSYILVIVDSFSKYLFARPTKTTNGKEAIHNLKDLFSLFGVPKRIISDCGKAFKSNNFKEFCLEYKIKHVLNTVSSPRSNGQVERYNRTLLEAINISIEDELEWYFKLPNVVWGINNTTNSSTGFTPHKLMFGFERNILGDLGEDNITINRENDRENAKNSMDKQSEQMKKHFDAKRKKSKEYKIGSLVLWSGANKDQKDICRKTKIRYGGPYKISKVLGNDRYQIVALKGMKGYQKYKAVVSAEQLRPWTGGVIHDSDTESEVNSTDELIDLLEG